MMMNQSVFMRIRENIQQNFSQNACCPHGFWPTKVIVKKFQIPYSFLSPECSLLSSGSAACKWYTSPSPFRPSYQVNVMLCHHHKPPIPLIYFFKPRTTHHFVVSSSPPCSHKHYLYLNSGWNSTLLVSNSCSLVLLLLLLLESLLRGGHLVCGFKALKV